MRVVLLTTARGQRPATVREVLKELGLADHPETEVVVVGLHYPKKPLPVAANLVVGPDLSVRRQAKSVPTRDDVAAAEAAGATAAPAAPATPTAPIYHPARVGKAVAWRARRARHTVRTNPAVVRVRNSTKVRRVKNKVLPGGLATRYAVACLSATNVGAAIEGADVVVALDSNTYRAAWLLARRHPRPAVVVGVAAGRRAVGDRAVAV
jgi:hypothetical protein